MIIKIKTIDEFEKFIIDESKDINFARFPVRIIIVDDIDTWIEVLRVLNRLSDKLIKASGFCKSDDGLPDITEMLSTVCDDIKVGNRLTLIPIQEIIKVLKDISLLNLFFFEVDPSKNARLYLPIIGFSKNLETFINSLNDIGIRKAHPIRVSFTKEGKTDKIKFFISRDKNLIEILKHTRKFEIIEGFRDYLKIFEGYDIKHQEFIVYSEILFDLEEKVEVNFTWEKLTNPSDVLLRLFNFIVPIPYSMNEESYWEKLLTEIIQGKYESFEIFLKNKFNFVRIDDRIFNKWQEIDNFEKWLVFNWAKSNCTERNSYLYKVLEASTTVNEFEDKIWNYPIENMLISDSLFSERINLIKKAFKSPPIGYYEYLKTIKDPHEKLNLLTGISFYEKREIIQTIAKIIESNNYKEEDLLILQENYPELYYYLNTKINDKLDLYMKNYIISKILNKDLYISELEKILLSFELYSYPPRNAVLEKFSCNQIWIDGLGIEWIGIILNLLFQFGYLVDYIITRANLPTTTEFNPFPNGVERFSDLDEIYHKQDRDYPDFLIDEIDTVSKLIIEKVRPLVEIHGEIIITSDHGATRFSGWQEDRIDIENIEIFRNGRYAKCITNIPENSNYYYIEQFNDGIYLISKTHRIFKGGKRTKVENHGGATIEESLIPIFHVRKKGTHKIPIKCLLLTKEIPIIKPIIELEYFPEISKLNLKIEKVSIEGEKVSENKWRFDLSNYKSMIRPKEYEIKIVSELGELDEKVNFKAGFIEEDLI